jgi:hypothetical protein
MLLMFAQGHIFVAELCVSMQIYLRRSLDTHTDSTQVRRTLWTYTSVLQGCQVILAVSLLQQASGAARIT